MRIRGPHTMRPRNLRTDSSKQDFARGWADARRQSQKKSKRTKVIREAATRIFDGIVRSSAYIMDTVAAPAVRMLKEASDLVFGIKRKNANTSPALIRKEEAQNGRPGVVIAYDAQLRIDDIPVSVFEAMNERFNIGCGVGVSVSITGRANRHGVVRAPTYLGATLVDGHHRARAAANPYASSEAQMARYAEYDDVLDDDDSVDGWTAARYAHLIHGPEVSPLRTKVIEKTAERWRFEPFRITFDARSFMCRGLRTHKNLEREMAFRYLLVCQE